MRKTMRAVALGSLILALAACQTGRSDDVRDDDGFDPGGDVGRAAGDLVLQVSSGGGFVPWGYDFRTVPALTVYGDGQVVAPGPMTLQYPGAALPNLLQTRLSTDDVTEIVRAATDAGLLALAPDYGMPGIADLPTTSVTIVVGGERFEHAAYALGMESPLAVPESADGDAELSGDADLYNVVGPWDDGLTEDQRAARATLTGFIQRANEIVGAAGAEDPYIADALAYLAMPASEWAGEPDFEPTVLPWPLETSLAAEGCTAVSGDDAATLLATLAQANDLTQFEQDGVAYQLFARPLLPHEATCADLGF